MARPNLYGSQPIAAPSRGGGGGGGNNRNRNRNRGQGGGGGNNQPGNGPLYGGDAGQALTNQDPEQYIQDLLNQLGVLDSSGTDYGTWRNTTMANSLLAGYNAAQANNQSLNPADYFQNTYGAGWNSGGRHNRNQQFNAGTLASIVGPTADQYVDYQSNTDPNKYLAGKFANAGLTMPTGGNADFTDFLNRIYTPQLLANQATAQAAGATSPDGTLVTTTPGNIMDTPVGALGGGGGRHGRNRNRHMLPTIPSDNTIRTAPGAGVGAPGGGTMPISLNDFVANQNLVDQARNMYAFRSNAQRQPSPLALAGRYSWWG